MAPDGPVTEPQWRASLDGDGRVQNWSSGRDSIAACGLEPSLRAEARANRKMPWLSSGDCLCITWVVSGLKLTTLVLCSDRSGLCYWMRIPTTLSLSHLLVRCA